MRNLRIFLLSLALAIGSTTGVQAAEPRAIAFKIDAQPVDYALKEFAGQSGLQVLFHVEGAAIPPGLKSPSIDGLFTPEAALQQLLANTGLRYEFINDRTVTIRARNLGSSLAPEQALQLARLDAAPAEDETKAVKKSADDKTNESDNDAQAVIVTGSRIRGQSGSVPLTTITAEEIQLSGQPTIANVLRQLPQNFGAHSDTADVDSFGGNVSRGAGVNLRGQGFDSTLVLVNGRRLSKSAGGLFTDISGIPASAVERIEVLPDGASAAYGADAIGGVVNIIMRKDFKGYGVSARGGVSTEGGYNDNLASGYIGLSSERGRLMVAVEGYRQSLLTQSEREFTGDGDYRSRGGTDRRVLTSSPGNITAVDGNLNLLSALVGTPVAAVASPTGQGGTALTPASFVPFVGTQNRTYLDSIAGLVPEQERYSLYASGEWQLTPSMAGFFDVLGSTRDHMRPYGYQTSTTTVAAGNPFNPFGESVRVQYAYKELGPLIYNSKAEAVNTTLGLRGEHLWSSQWNWEFAGHYGVDNVHNVGGPFLNTTAIAAAVARTDRATALNLFGDGSAATAASLAGITGTNTVDQESRYQMASFVTEGPVVSLPAGMVRSSLGAEYSDERIDTLQVTTHSGVRRAQQGGRTLRSAFAEVSVPVLNSELSRGILSRLELNLQGRYDQYSDFGSAFNPKIGIVASPMKGLTLRGSWGESFKTPLLRDITETPTILSLPYLDPNRGDSPTIEISTGGNSALNAETAESWNAGLSYAWSSFGNFAVGLNYFDITYANRIIRPDDPALLFASEAYLPAGVIVRAAPTPADVAAGRPGVLVSFSLQPLNLSVLQTSGFDADFNFSAPVFGGATTFGVTWTHITDYKSSFVAGTPVIDRVGTLGNPQKDRFRAMAGWGKQAFSTALTLHYSSSGLESLVASNRRHIDNHATLDLVFNYESSAANGLLSGVRFTAGATNLTDERPAVVNLSGGYDPLTDDPRGRVVYLSIAKSW